MEETWGIALGLIAIDGDAALVWGIKQDARMPRLRQKGGRAGGKVDEGGEGGS